MRSMRRPVFSPEIRIPGSDNTSITVAFAICFLLSSPEYYHRLRKELDEAFPDPICSLSLNTLADLAFLDAVINETLRLASPYFNPRIIPHGGSVIDGKYIPGGTIVALAAHSQQVSPENFHPSPQVCVTSVHSIDCTLSHGTDRSSFRIDGCLTDLVRKPGPTRRCSRRFRMVRRYWLPLNDCA